MLADPVARNRARNGKHEHGMSRERILPASLGLVHGERRTPWVAILGTTAIGRHVDPYETGQLEVVEGPELR